MTLDALPPFVPGLALSERFFHTAVEPLLAAHFPEVRYAAACLGRGSDVMGFDTPQSRDHHWGPRTTLFLEEKDLGRRRFTHEYLGVDATQPIDERAWLAIPSQRLRTVHAGRVFRDDLGLATVRARLDWYPRDVWLYRMANQWRRIDQEEPWVGRCGDVSDELGSRIVATRLIVELMRLCFLIEREYWPYFKWFGTAFSRLRCAATLTPIFHDVLNAGDWKMREAALGPAYLHVGAMHNELALTELIEPRLAPFFGRPYQVPHAMRFVDALLGAIESPTVRALPPYVGAVDQFADSTDILDEVSRAQALMVVYDPGA